MEKNRKLFLGENGKLILGKRKKIILGIIAAVLLVGLAFGVKYYRDFEYYQKAMSALTIENIDPKDIKDGTYTGSFDARVISAVTRVTVKDGKITNIELLEHKNGRGKPAEAIVDKILEEQSLDVDAVSGATNSSKTILKAVENALNNGAV
ncbi:MAG TPA: FMN-binding protein [Anaerovoracaceae bacterium]|nr:FMN-binding protein [Anaerovoracaceae bacterium]